MILRSAARKQPRRFWALSDEFNTELPCCCTPTVCLKSDRVDAEKPARFALVDPNILRPITHRSVALQESLTLIHILGPFGREQHASSLGLHLMVRGRKNARKKALVAVARKLAVLLHSVWVTQVGYVVGNACSLKSARDSQRCLEEEKRRNWAVGPPYSALFCASRVRICSVRATATFTKSYKRYRAGLPLRSNCDCSANRCAPAIYERVRIRNSTLTPHTCFQ